MIFDAKDLELFAQKGITQEQVEEQLRNFETGFPALEVKNAASVKNGIVRNSEDEIILFLKEWENYLQSDKEVVKFVPASGAASRMFKNLFEFLEGENNEPATDFEKKFFNEINKFAFYPDLDDACKKNTGKSIEELIKNNRFKWIVDNLLNSTGLNYGSLPKGLLKFHKYEDGNRTPFQEHLVEGALYAKNKGNGVKIHFTVSAEHHKLFEKHLLGCENSFEKKTGAKFNVSFSEQKPSTDTIAVDTENRPFRENGKILFRPGGHGALIANLNEIDGDIIFIKNIDNVVPDSMKEDTVTYKKLLAGILVNLQRQAFSYLKELENKEISDAKLTVIAQFTEVKLNNKPADKSLKGEKLREYLIKKLNRPMRVCGMVKNEGEPGGGPFWAKNPDNTVSLQILESSQFSDENKNLMNSSTHFNPVDLVCAVKDYNGNKFNLLKSVDKNTGFISSKSKNGKELKALELPGLWNGAMSDWNTIFVEVPSTTFNPVKTVNDLLRKEHQ